MEKKTTDKVAEVKKVAAKAKEETVKAKKVAEKEMKKIKGELVALEKKTSAYITKNPHKAMAVSAGIGAALGAVAAFFAAHGRRKK